MIYIKVSENGTLHTFDCTVSDSVKYETVRFDFPESWDGYTKTAVFRHGDITLSVILNGDSDLCVGADECYIPHEVIKFPEFTVSVFGVSGDSRVTASQAAIRVIQSGYGEGDEPSDPTPTEYEQLITLANETKEIAQSVRDDSAAAIASANAAANKANESANSANEAAANANKAASIAESSASAADTAVTNANTAATEANMAAEKAKTAAINADSSAVNANAATDNANTAAANAESIVMRANTTFANALKASKRGASILIDDVSPVTHEMEVRLSSDTVEDLTTVKLSRCGKNLFDISSSRGFETLYSGLTNTINGNELITVCSVPSRTGHLELGTFPQGTYTFSYVGPTGWALFIMIGSDILNLTVLGSAFMGNTKTFTLSKESKVWIRNTGFSSGTYSFKNIQLELGSIATDYEPYNGAEYFPTAGGTVEGVTSLYPNTTLMTDTDGVTIDCEYNRDINKAFAELQQAIISLGGNV